MVTNALVPALPSIVEYQLVPQGYLLETVQQHPEEIILSRVNPGEHAISEHQTESMPFPAREGFQKRTPFSGEFMSGPAFHWSTPGHEVSSRWPGESTHSATYGSDACLITNPIEKGTYVDLYF